jgi:hypothetical protein
VVVLAVLAALVATAAAPSAAEASFGSPGAGVPWMAYSPFPGGPVAEDWSIHGSGSGNTGPGSPEQTWQWQLTAVP